ncbi:c-type cytochrome [Parapedobacter indicus]|uniref:Cytochrome c n=1 Tax=Parapedobacter indicus TaxID=1477437 RepID=A0A1I3FUT5_9SPHI|nr:c-type cytochrome [Parapedobacter indicus]PPL03893.1 cytochrome c [Parapedobacter indicus]SFI14812.1 cytochrome c [Parapedobacter indicus]
MHTFTFNTVIFAFILLLVGCGPDAASRRKGELARNNPRKRLINKLAGDIDVVPTAETIDKGRVLMSYSDCFTCHKEADRKRGPAFNDIAARYPMNSTYIRILAKRIVLGTKGSWGNVVMPPHPTISEGDAEKMVMYILSLDGLD